jgi:GMP synthase (glutamine-hydrolysing)
MTQTAHPDSVLIIDFGSQVTQLIGRRVREAGVYCEIIPFQSAEEAFHRMRPKAIIFSGGPASVLDPGSPRAPQIAFDSGLPILASATASRRWRPSSAARWRAAMPANSAAPMSRS